MQWSEFEKWTFVFLNDVIYSRNIREYNTCHEVCTTEAYFTVTCGCPVQRGFQPIFNIYYYM